ncbi:MAG TPA: ArsA-related P-loop ATPase [Methylomirabilota bacterium]|nr:ArsA-related P-loop ATPase [Methylomirabilota bacterium]
MPLYNHISHSTLTSLLQKRVLFFVGKGGVGKTTVTSALALAAARRGKKTLLIEIEANNRAARLLGLPPLENPTNILREVSPALFALSITGAAALEEYLHLIIPVRRLVRMLVESRPYQYFVAAAPGLKELLTLGKVWYEERKREVETQQSRWDLLLVDLPATGHGLQYLQMPYAARDTFSDGIVHREAERIVTWLQDGDKTAVNLVTTAEELPVSETLDAHKQLVEKLQLPLGVLFINRAHEAPLSSEPLAHIRVSTKGSAEDRALATEVLACARTEAALVEMQTTYLQQLYQLSLPFVPLPFCFSSEFGPAQVEELARYIEFLLHSKAAVPTRTSRRRKKKTEPLVQTS